MKISSLRKMTITGLLCCGSLLGCSHINDDNQISELECRLIQHSMGESCVPLNPERVVVLDNFSLEGLIALDLLPIGHNSWPGYLDGRPFLKEKLETVVSVGSGDQPSIEQILNLKPDLILGLNDVSSIYPQLSQIAPTVLHGFYTSGQWQEIFYATAEALGREEQGEKVIQDYFARLEEFKSAMGDRLTETEVSILRIYSTKEFQIYSETSFAGVVINDAGSLRPESQRNLTRSDPSYSREVLTFADGDVMFLWSHEDEEGWGQVDAIHESLQSDLLWLRLEAVQANRVYRVPSYWIGSSIFSAHAVIDDLFKHLVDEWED